MCVKVSLTGHVTSTSVYSLLENGVIQMVIQVPRFGGSQQTDIGRCRRIAALFGHCVRSVWWCLAICCVSM